MKHTIQYFMACPSPCGVSAFTKQQSFIPRIGESVALQTWSPFSKKITHFSGKVTNVTYKDICDEEGKPETEVIQVDVTNL